MSWNPLEALKRKWSGRTAPGAATPESASAAQSPQQALPALREIERQGLLPKFFRHWKNPAFLKQIQALAARMNAAGVDIKNRNAVQAWLASHQKELESGQWVDAPAVKPQTYVKTSPDVGRNDPCPCGSGKKHKKCCGSKP